MYSTGIDACTVEWHGVDGLFVPPIFLILFNDKNVVIEIFAIHNVHVFLQDHESDV
jgi:hypothetical protein